MGKSYGTDDDLQYRVPYPEIRWSRDFPRVASERASFTEDPNWPPAPGEEYHACLLYTSPSPRDPRGSRMPSSA